MGLSATVTVTETAETTMAEVGGDDLGLLIGRHGQTIDALQYLAAIVVNRRRKSRREVVVDAEGYRERRTSSLHVLADRAAQRVAREHTPVTAQADDRGRAQGHPCASEGPPAGGDGLGGTGAAPRSGRRAARASSSACRRVPM